MIKWILNRARLMSPAELLFYRPKQIFRSKIVDRYSTQKKKGVSGISVNSSYSPNSYSKKYIQSLLPENSNFSNYQIFSATTVNLGKKIEWRKDYEHNILSPVAFYADINRQDFSKNGDVKNIAELSRFHFFPYLAFKASLQQDETSVNLLKNHLEEWLRQNPFLNSINWTSGIEVGIRSVNLIYTHEVLTSLGMLTEELDGLIKKHIGLNYLFLRNHQSKYSSANNHRVAELTGLVIISSYFTSKIIEKERKKWRQLFFQEFKNQIYSDGVNKELSFRYHAEVLDHFLNGVLFIEKAGNKIPESIYECLKKMSLFINDCIYNKNVIEFSDSDQGYLVHPYFDEEFNIYQSLLDSANIKFKLGFPSSKKLDSHNYLLFGDAANAVLEKTRNVKKKSEKEDKLYPQGGYCFMHDNAEKARVIFDVGEIGDDLTAAHGHSDILHFTFEKNGFPFIIDPGTYQYHSKDGKWREYFRGISAHNTISINGLNHAEPCTRMGWIKRPKTEVIEFKANSDISTCLAKHDAFNTASIETIHEREIQMDKINKKVMIIDRLKKNNNNKDRLYFYLHFHPKCEINHMDDSIKLNYKNQTISIKNDFFKQAEIIIGDKAEPLGWYSDKYECKEESATLKLTTEFNKDITLKTFIYYN